MPFISADEIIRFLDSLESTFDALDCRKDAAENVQNQFVIRHR